MDARSCPTRIWTDIGGGFSMGFFGGTLWYGMKALYAGGSGFRGDRMRFAIFKNGPATGGAFASWAGLFSACDCALETLRGKTDPINPIVAGGVTGGFIASRMGWKASVSSAITGMMILGLIEGVIHILQGVAIHSFLLQDEERRKILQQKEEEMSFYNPDADEEDEIDEETPVLADRLEKHRLGQSTFSPPTHLHDEDDDDDDYW